VRRFLALIVCAFGLSASSARCQVSTVKPIQIASGTILTFHLQTRLRTVAGDPLNDVPAGTLLQVRMLDSGDAAANADGVPFRGSVVSPLILAGQVIVHADAEVLGLQILLRNRNHPEGVRYELLITSLVDHGESYTITASFDPTPSDGMTTSLPVSKDTGTSDQGLNTKPSAAN
jgi:hypothetical protein